MPKGKQSDARSRTTQNRLKMYDTRAKRDKKGKVVWEAFKSKDESHQARIQPDRRWFGSTRTVDQDELSRFRDEMAKQKSSPATYVLKPGKVPFSLLNDVKQVRPYAKSKLGHEKAPGAFICRQSPEFLPIPTRSQRP